jgi:hypothetical protein
MPVSIAVLRNGMLGLMGASFLAGFVAGCTQASTNLPPIWEPWKWIALGRELDRTILLLEQDKAELIEAIKQEQGTEEQLWTTKTTKTN